MAQEQERQPACVRVGDYIHGVSVQCMEKQARTHTHRHAHALAKGGAQQQAVSSVRTTTGRPQLSVITSYTHLGHSLHI